MIHVLELKDSIMRVARLMHIYADWHDWLMWPLLLHKQQSRSFAGSCICLTNICVPYDPRIHFAWLIYVCDSTRWHWCAWRYSCIFPDMTRSCTGHECFIRVMQLIYVYNMNLSYVWHDLFTRVVWSPPFPTPAMNKCHSSYNYALQHITACRQCVGSVSAVCRQYVAVCRLCVAVCCSVLQCVAVCFSALAVWCRTMKWHIRRTMTWQKQLTICVILWMCFWTAPCYYTL